MRHTNNFDAVRLFAAVLVLVSHQIALAGDPEPIVLGGTLGGYGVCIFFSISGYLIAQSWTRSPDLFRFAANRLRRIWPGYAVCVLLTAFVLGPLVTNVPLREYFESPDLVRYFRLLMFDMQYRLPGVFTSNPYPVTVNGSLWTIPLELAWYAVVAGLGLVGVLKRPHWMVAAGVLLIAYVLLRSYTGKQTAPPLLIVFGGCFLIGATLSRLRTSLFEKPWWWLASGLALALVCARFGIWFGVFYAAIPVTSILVGEARTPFVRDVGRYGDFSYGFYLYAFPVQQTLVWATDNRLAFPVGLAASFAITLACAVVSWKLVEGPAMRIGRARDAVRQPGLTAA